MIFTREYRDNWGILNKVLFRFLFLYCILYILLLFFSFILEIPVRWFATNILHWGDSFSVTQTGSGDTTYSYVLLALNLFLACLGTLLWCAVDYKRKSYNTLFYWFQVILRIFLFFFMLTYGFVKVFKTQFPDPSLLKLLQPVGELSPMGLAWTYMGYSVAYNIFVGFAEILGGVLVLFKKNITLGALIIIGVMTHVAVMNFTYDIPVKLFSVHLVFMALILFLTDIKRFLNIFFRNRPTEKVNLYAPINDKTYSKIILIVKLVILVLIVGLFSFQGILVLNSHSTHKMKAPFYGIWEVETFNVNNETIAPLITDKKRWRYLVLDSNKKTAVKQMNDSIKWYNIEIDSIKKNISLYSEKKDSAFPNFQYHFLDKEILQLSGKLNGDSLNILLKRKNREDLRLINRGFHWVNEYPYNR